MEVLIVDYREFLIKLADCLDKEGEHQAADILDENFEEFLKLLEEGKLDFNFLFYGIRDPEGPYSNKGREMPACGVPGVQ